MTASSRPRPESRARREGRAVRVLRSAVAAAFAASTMIAARAGAAQPDRASVAPGRRLRLEDALAYAFQHNSDLALARDAVVAADAGVRLADEHPDPALSVVTGRIHLDGLGDRTPLGNELWSRGYDTVAQLGQPLEWRGERGARGRISRFELAAARARLADTRRTLESAVVAAYAGAALAEANVGIARESAGLLREEARIARARWDAGDISHSDLDQIEIAAARIELDARQAASLAHTQRVALALLIGLPLADGETMSVDSLETLLDRAVEPVPVVSGGIRSDLAAARAETRRADAAWRLERSRRLPDPTLVLQFEHQPPDRSDSFGLGLAWPLPLWNRNGAAIALARVARDDARETERHVAAGVASDSAASAEAFDEAMTRWRRYHDELKPRSETIRRSVSLAYEKGGASLLDLLEAQRSDNDVRLATAQAAGDAAIAVARLRAAVERIPEPETRR